VYSIYCIRYLIVVEYVTSVKMIMYTTSDRDIDVRSLTKGIHSHKCIVRQFCPCANVTECTYTNLYSTTHYKHRL